MIYQIAYLGIGIGVAPGPAISSAGVPCPVSDANWDGWLWHSVVPVIIGDLRRPITQWTDGMIDSRAMRRLDDNLPFIAFELITDAGVAVNFIHAAHIRFLLKPTGR
jgi:hypothetical protein